VESGTLTPLHPSGFTFGGDYSVAYGYGSLGSLSSVGWGSYTASYSYVDNSGLVAGYDIPVGTNTFRTRKTYEPNRNLITTITNATIIGGTTSVSSAYAYQNDALGRRTERIDNASITNSFGYNNRNELVSADMGTNEYGYAYDPIGNRLSVTSVSSVVDYLSNQLNQYTNIADGVTNTPTYDLDGNMLTYADWTFTWNGENRLIGATNADHTISFVYDFMGRRVKKIADGVTNTFTYDGWNVIREREGVAAIDFYDYTIESYTAGDDISGTVTVEDSGRTLKMVGNLWKKIAYAYTVTTNTILEFDFKSGAQGEIHGIGFDTDNNHSSDKTFELYGTQTWGIQTYRGCRSVDY